MKYAFLILLTIVLFSCNQKTDQVQVLQNRIDSLKHEIEEAYKPGFGDFMSSLQVHHGKLWFAGQNQNWELADFEIHEIEEAIEDIRKYQKDRKESQMMTMIEPSLERIEVAIDQKDPVLFKKEYIELTNTCNSCHRSTDHGFIVVKSPDSPPFSNQKFKPLEK